MKPMRKTAFASHMIIAATGAVLALSLTGCGGQTTEDPEQSEEAQSGDSAEAGETDGQMAGSAQTQEPTESAGSQPSQSASEDPFADAAKTTNWASDDRMKIDKKGNGKVPARSIEADLVDLFENKLDFKVKKAECSRDMDLKEWYGFDSCDVTVKDTTRADNKKTYYGTVEIVDHKDKMVKYELVFPGIDKKDFDFKD